MPTSRGSRRVPWNIAEFPEDKYVGLPRCWLVTGCSAGLGRSLAEGLIAREERVIATARNSSSLDGLVAGHCNAHAMTLDVTSEENIRNVVDVLVNNAGYGYISSVEEADEAAYRPLFETNVLGLIALTRAVLPGMRERRRGHVVNVSSAGGKIGNPGSAFYAGTKFAVIGFSEALSKEVAPLDIKVTVVAPGPFRTDCAGRWLQTAPVRIDAYAETVHKQIESMNRMSGTQEGDQCAPAKRSSLRSIARTLRCAWYLAHRASRWPANSSPIPRRNSMLGKRFPVARIFCSNASVRCVSLGPIRALPARTAEGLPADDGSRDSKD